MTIQEQIQKLQQDIKNANELFNAQLKALEEQLKKEQERKVWKPNYNDRVYMMYANGVSPVFFSEENGVHNSAYIRGNLVKTQEEAVWKDQHRIVATELKNYVAEHDPRPITEEDWNDEDVNKYYLSYDYCDGFDYCAAYYCKTANQVYASNTEVLKNAVEHIGEDRIKKYYFGVGV